MNNHIRTTDLNKILIALTNNSTREEVINEARKFKPLARATLQNYELLNLPINITKEKLQNFINSTIGDIHYNNGVYHHAIRSFSINERRTIQNQLRTIKKPKKKVWKEEIIF